MCADGWLQYVATVSRPWENPDWAGEVGRVEDVLRKHADMRGHDAAHSIAYLCGHPQMVESGKALLSRAGFQKAQLKEEKYSRCPRLKPRRCSGEGGDSGAFSAEERRSGDARRRR